MSGELALAKVYVTSLTHDMDLDLIFLTDRKKKNSPWCFELLDAHVNESMQVANM